MISPVLKLAKIVGTSTERAWSQVHTFFPPEKEKKSQRGDLLAVLALSGLGEGTEAVAAGREIIARIHEEYFGNLKGGALSRLKRAVEKVAAEAEPPAKIEIGAAAVLGKVLYLASIGGCRIILRREGKLGTLLTGSDESETASGYLKEGDLFLLGTPGFFNLVDGGVLRAALEADSPQEAEENLAAVVHGRGVDGGEAALIVKVEKLGTKESTESKEEEKPAPAPAPPLDQSLLEKIKRLTRLNLAALSVRLTLSLKKIIVFLRSRLGKRAIYLTKEKPQRQQKTIFTVAAVLFFLLGISVVLGMSQRSRLASQKETGSLLDQAQQKVAEGQALLDLNPSRSRQLFLEAKELTDKIEEKGEKGAQFVDFKQELEKLLASVLREHEVEATVFLDLTLIKEGSAGDKMAASEDQMVILDKRGASVYGVGISQKTSQILAGGKLFEGVSQIAAFGKKVFALTPEGIIGADVESGEQTLVVKADEEWGEIIDLVGYGSNLYLLDSEGTIWKYPATEGGLGARQTWLKGETRPDFSNSVSMAIDGSIWILTAEGQLMKFTQGRLDAFGIAGLDKPLSKPIAVYTDDDQERLYLLDQGNLRVVVLGKSGEYDSTYLWPGISGVSDMVVSEADKKILLLSDSKIYEIELEE